MPANSGTCASASRARAATFGFPPVRRLRSSGAQPTPTARGCRSRRGRRVGGWRYGSWVGVALDRTEGGVTRRIPHGEVIVRQGDAVTSLYLVTAGAVRLSSVTASGREIVVGLLCQGDLFGESALLGDPSQVRAQAVGPTMLLALPIPSLRAILERNPHTAEELLRLVAARLHRTSAALEDALSADVSARVAGRLRDLAIHHGVPEPDRRPAPGPADPGRARPDGRRLQRVGEPERGGARGAGRRPLERAAPRDHGPGRAGGVDRARMTIGVRLTPAGPRPCTKRRAAPARARADRTARTTVARSSTSGRRRPWFASRPGPRPRA